MIILYRERTKEGTYRVGRLPKGPIIGLGRYIKEVQTTQPWTRFFAVEDDIPEGNLRTITWFLEDRYFDKEYLGRLGAKEVLVWKEP